MTLRLITGLTGLLLLLAGASPVSAGNETPPVAGEDPSKHALVVRDGYVRMFESASTGTPPPAVDDPNRCVDILTLEKIASSAGIGEYLHPGLREVGLQKRFERWASNARIGVANLKVLHESGAVIAMGTDAGNPLTVHDPSVYWEMEAMQAAGMSPHDVLVASTRNSARAMARESEIGTVETGKIADMIILGADPTADITNMRRLETVIRAGVVHTVADLQRGNGET